MTPTGSERAMSAFGKDVHHVYLPYDLPGAMNRFLNTVQPKLVIVMETELWPNMVAALHKRKIPLVIANAPVRTFRQRLCQTGRLYAPPVEPHYAYRRAE